MEQKNQLQNFVNDYKVISFSDNFDDPEATDFDVEIESDTDRRTIYVNYELFLSWIEKTSPPLVEYLKKYKLNDFDVIFEDLQSLGFDYKENLQKWVDKHVTEEMIREDEDMYEGEDEDEWEEIDF